MPYGGYCSGIRVEGIIWYLYTMEHLDLAIFRYPFYHIYGFPVNTSPLCSGMDIYDLQKPKGAFVQEIYSDVSLKVETNSPDAFVVSGRENFIFPF